MIRGSYWHSVINLHYVLLSSELMLLGFISLLLTATSSMIANICIPSRFYDSTFAPCSRSEIEKETENKSSEDRKLLMVSLLPHLFRRVLNNLNQNTCPKVHHLSTRNKPKISISTCIIHAYAHAHTRVCAHACLWRYVRLMCNICKFQNNLWII